MNKQGISPDAKVFRIMEIVAAEMDGETVMISIENGKYYGMDAIGSRIWELLETPKSVAEVIQVLGEEYEVEQQQCQADTIEFLDFLFQEGLVKVA
ncbi:lasso peptide biosynthesis PqqD family chaperone [Sporomusa acidovorans]|uniref:Coenzyme PQQ synthesis protein D n=1 Tax=Sporomusa acidovorans (strain ATCC 49682 / DSM 3132 / Mol) TaxID=1123286 RepID=A0ABZ3IYJ8_SPOA4|nr:lasso peptide biosynthesis PqqD family chaperone [Sporomusa acidovorans]OZC17247.1 coenzyme PQQ synthesis protein D PqqD [Sporomusa acidovorans DSM 3132]SDF15675.1 Coenzyme PQQ synthesis protein D (PqqD) [Sporomusa acidovorans]